MISAILFVNEKGEVVIGRYYKDNVNRSTIDEWRLNVIAAKELGNPVVRVHGTSFMFIRHRDMFIVAVSKENSNAALVFQFLYDLVDVFQAYFGAEFDEQALRNNFVLIYELLDETMDHGYPQIVSASILTEYIKHGKVKADPKALASKSQGITQEITGAIDWRQPGKHKYKKNQVFIDVLEAVNVLVGSDGTQLKADVTGKVVMKALLSGMPRCKLGLNDKVVMDQEQRGYSQKRTRNQGIAIDDIRFHRCVGLGKFDADRTISFIPPDGEFDLMRYRITQNVDTPFQVIPVITQHGRSRIEFEIKVKATYSNKLNSSFWVMRVPVPKNTSKTKIKVSSGKHKYDPSQSCVTWTIPHFAGQLSYVLRGEVFLTALISDKPWSRPPITLDFQLSFFTASGLRVRFLKVFEQSDYKTIKWVRYITRAGQYSIRI